MTAESDAARHCPICERRGLGSDYPVALSLHDAHQLLEIAGRRLDRDNPDERVVLVELIEAIHDAEDLIEATRDATRSNR